MFEELEKINARPEPFKFYTATDLWTDEHTSEQMLAFHLNEEIDVSSRNADFINRSGGGMGTPMILCVSYSVKPEAQISFKRSGFAEKLLKTSGDRRSM